MNKAFYSKRNQHAWEIASKNNEALLLGYLIAGDPSAAKSIEIVQESMMAGIDIIEIGIPSRNPYMDGEIIKRGHRRVLENNEFKEEQLLEYCYKVRMLIEKPIWAMGYKTDLIDTGLYLKLVQNDLIDALVLPDCTLAQQHEIDLAVRETGVDVIRFAASSMTDQELAEACQNASIMYAQSYRGATGNPLAKLDNLAKLYRRVRSHTAALIIAGFGLRSPEKVRLAIESGFEGAVAGSVLVARCENREQDYLYRLIAEMKLQTKLGIRKE